MSSFFYHFCDSMDYVDLGPWSTLTNGFFLGKGMWHRLDNISEKKEKYIVDICKEAELKLITLYENHFNYGVQTPKMNKNMDNKNKDNRNRKNKKNRKNNKNKKRKIDQNDEDEDNDQCITFCFSDTTGNGQCQ